MLWNDAETTISRDFWEHDLSADGAFWLTKKWLKHFSGLPKQCPIELESSARCKNCSARKSRKERKGEGREEGGEGRGVGEEQRSKRKVRPGLGWGTVSMLEFEKHFFKLQNFCTLYTVNLQGKIMHHFLTLYHQEIFPKAPILWIRISYKA